MKAIMREMREISKEQESIKEGDSQAIDDECQQLRRETNQIIQKAANSEIRLALMFQILEARTEGDFAKAHQLTALLREVVAMDELIAEIES
ncbi:Glycine--tRNA ligase alpha subunit [Gossypium australe]|uniref:Glycine--tRNA ligase alpha subunit n=1 Tax=Gossypium australe TaxID=47621 RepID=A0A5B6VHA9_9ROSI|nr:Glycine--tRNA ligase alpha subunit [Gossypium australe]